MSYRANQVIDGVVRLIQPIGSGGCGEVWLGEHLILEKKVAIKLCKDWNQGRFQKYAKVGEIDAYQMFKRDAQVHFRLKDKKHAAAFYGAGVNPDDGNIYTVQGLINGPNLKDYLQGRKLEMEKMTVILLQISEGLSEAHQEGIIHNDLKLENILIEEEKVKLVDFGLSIFDKEKVMSGSLPFSAPEAIERRAEPASDVWSLGVVGYYLWMGKLPFRSSKENWSSLNTSERREQEEELKWKIKNEEPEPLSGDLGKIIMRCLRKNPAERYQNGQELWKELDGLVNKRIWWVVEQHQEVKADDKEGMRKMVGELLVGIAKKDARVIEPPIDNKTGDSKFLPFLPGDYHYLIQRGSKGWARTDAKFWTAGFWTAKLWLDFEETGDEKFKKWAEEWTRPLSINVEGRFEVNVLGCNTFNGFVKAYKVTGENFYLEKAVQATYKIIKSFNRFGFIQTDKKDEQLYTFAMESCMPLLVWAYRITGDEQIKKVIDSHVEKSKLLVRSDGSVREIVRIDGKETEETSKSGYGDSSHRTRDMARFLYGLSFLSGFEDTEERIRNCFLNNLPEDLITLYDLKNKSVKDASSQAMVVNSLLRKKQIKEALKLQLALIPCVSIDEEYQGCLLHCCKNINEAISTDGTLIYGDSYFLRNWKEIKDKI